MRRHWRSNSPKPVSRGCGNVDSMSQNLGTRWADGDYLQGKRSAAPNAPVTSPTRTMLMFGATLVLRFAARGPSPDGTFAEPILATSRTPVLRSRCPLDSRVRSRRRAHVLHL